jgi:Domain of unknown function (DUF4145)
VRYFPPAVVRDPPKWRFRLQVDMREVMEEIYRSIDSDNVRLPMMGARTLLDMVILEKIGDVGTFKEKLLELEKEGLVSPRNREALYAALEVGNAAARRGHAATKSEVQDVMDIVETMLQAIYVFPSSRRASKRILLPDLIVRRKVLSNQYPQSYQPRPADISPSWSTLRRKVKSSEC